METIVNRVNVSAFLEDDDTFVSDPNSNFTLCTCGDMSKEHYSDTYATFNFVLIIICLPILATFGVYTNVVNVYIYTRKPMRTNSGNVYLAALGGSDFFVVLNGMLMFCLDSARSYLKLLDQSLTEVIPFVLPFGYMAQFCSVYFTVGTAFDCYIKTCCSGRLRRIFATPRRAKQFVCCTVLFSVAYNMVRFWQFEIRTCFEPIGAGKDDPESNSGPTEYAEKREICPTELFLASDIPYNIYLYTILMTFLPFLVLSMLNAFVLRSMQAQAKALTKPEATAATGLLQCTATALSVRPELIPVVSEEDTITMAMVVALFLACNTLALVTNIVETFFKPDAMVLNFMTDISNFLVIFNSSVNFVIYMRFSKPYKRLYVSHFCAVEPSPMSTKNSWTAMRSSGSTGHRFSCPGEVPGIVANNNGDIRRNSAHPTIIEEEMVSSNSLTVTPVSSPNGCSTLSANRRQYIPIKGANEEELRTFAMSPESAAETTSSGLCFTNENVSSVNSTPVHIDPVQRVWTTLRNGSVSCHVKLAEKDNLVRAKPSSEKKSGNDL